MLERFQASGNPQGRSIRAFLWAMLPLIILSQFYRSSNSVIAPDLVRDLALSPEQLGWLTGSFFLVFAALQLPMGVFFDRFGARNVLCALMFLAIGGSLLFGLADGVAELVTARFMIGAGCAGLMVGSLVVMSRWVEPAKFGAVVAFLFAWANAGNLIATTPMAAASEFLGWRATFFVLAALSAILTALFYWIVRDAPPGHDYWSKRPDSLAQVARGVGETMRAPGLKYVLPMVAVGYASFTAIFSLWGGPYLHAVFALDPIERGNILSTVAMAMIVGTLFYGQVERRIRAPRVIVTAGALATAATLAILCLRPNPTLAEATVALALFGFFGSYSVIVMSRGLALFDDRHRGRGTTLLNTALMGGAAAIQVASGSLVDAFVDPDSPAFAYRVAFGVIATSIVMAVLYYRRLDDLSRRNIAAGLPAPAASLTGAALLDPQTSRPRPAQT